MKNLFILFLFISALTLSCRSGEAKKTVQEKPQEALKKEPQVSPVMDLKNCICVQLWMPVCGENGKTYSNSCFANCAHVKYTPGSCSKQIED